MSGTAINGARRPLVFVYSNAGGNGATDFHPFMTGVIQPSSLPREQRRWSAALNAQTLPYTVVNATTTTTPPRDYPLVVIQEVF